MPECRNCGRTIALYEVANGDELDGQVSVCVDCASAKSLEYFEHSGGSWGNWRDQTSIGVPAREGIRNGTTVEPLKPETRRNSVENWPLCTPCGRYLLANRSVRFKREPLVAHFLDGPVPPLSSLSTCRACKTRAATMRVKVRVETV